jgi:hypothetical protein
MPFENDRVKISDTTIVPFLNTADSESFPITFSASKKKLVSGGEDGCGIVGNLNGWKFATEVVILGPDDPDDNPWRDEREYCVTAGLGAKENFEFYAKTPDEPGSYLVTVNFLMAESRDVIGSYQFDLTVEGEDQSPDAPWDSEDWKEIPPDKAVEEGEIYRTFACINADNLPFGDVAPRLQISALELTNAFNAELPEGIEGEVLKTELYETDGYAADGVECDFMYIVYYKITNIEEGTPTPDRTGISYTVLAALGLVLGIAIASAVILWRFEVLLNTPGGEKTADRLTGSLRNVSIAVLLFGGGYLLSQVVDATGGGEEGEGIFGIDFGDGDGGDGNGAVLSDV